MASAKYRIYGSRNAWEPETVLGYASSLTAILELLKLIRETHPAYEIRWEEVPDGDKK